MLGISGILSDIRNAMDRRDKQETNTITPTISATNNNKIEKTKTDVIKNNNRASLVCLNITAIDETTRVPRKRNNKNISLITVLLIDKPSTLQMTPFFSPIFFNFYK